MTVRRLGVLGIVLVSVALVAAAEPASAGPVERTVDTVEACAEGKGSCPVQEPDPNDLLPPCTCDPIHIW